MQGKHKGQGTRRGQFCCALQVLNDTSLRAILHISHAGPRRFRVYKIVAKNAIGRTTHTVLLHRSRFYPIATVQISSIRAQQKTTQNLSSSIKIYWPQFGHLDQLLAEIELSHLTSTLAPTPTHLVTSDPPGGAQGDSGSHYIFIISQASRVVGPSTFHLVLFQTVLCTSLYLHLHPDFSMLLRWQTWNVKSTSSALSSSARFQILHLLRNVRVRAIQTVQFVVQRSFAVFSWCNQVVYKTQVTTKLFTLKVPYILSACKSANTFRTNKIQLPCEEIVFVNEIEFGKCLLVRKCC